MDKKEFYWNYYVEQREHSRKIHTERTSVSNFIITISGALLAYATSQDFSAETRPVSAFVMILGLYGVFMVLKLHEHSQYSLSRARESLKNFDEQFQKNISYEVMTKAQNIHNPKYPRIRKVRMHMAWVILHLMIVFLGGFSFFGGF